MQVEHRPTKKLGIVGQCDRRHERVGLEQSVDLLMQRAGFVRLSPQDAGIADDGQRQLNGKENRDAHH